jgi:hypothetical protein
LKVRILLATTDAMRFVRVCPCSTVHHPEVLRGNGDLGKPGRPQNR